MGRHVKNVQALANGRRARMAGLQGQMALSYVWTTVIVVLALELLALFGLACMLLLIVTPYVYTLEARQVAQHYALVASLQAQPTALNPQSTFQAGQTGTLELPGQSSAADPVAVPYIARQAANDRRLAIALLIAPDGSIRASSYPQRYPVHGTSGTLLPERGPLIKHALTTGTPSSGQKTGLDANSVFALEPVWNRQLQPIGAVYVQLTNLPSLHDIFMLPLPWLALLLIGSLVLLVLLPPISGLFGVLTMRGPIRRIRRLVRATAQLANGDYEQRVTIGRQDEIGQLEHYFNRMGWQLAASSRQQQVLTEQNARLAERARLSRDLHDSMKQQVFALATQIGAALTLLDAQPDQSRTHLEIAGELAYQARQELTALIQERRPSRPPETGFEQLLRSELERWSRYNDIPITSQLHPVIGLPPIFVQELLQVVREALANIARHSQANRVECYLQQDQEQLVLTIADNGCGFEPTSISPQSVGLQSMRERLAEVGGNFQLQSQPGQGTQIKCVAPLRHVMQATYSGELDT
ncbi:hypothetical protein KDA_40890 [Dictyobacter alpinus]|uniref:histidine kinase n=1 Tax=Dictyobacter alpinus TaxID=2014873 RepID=A0A402BB78_9CHLR|nr:HAMP domain-containing protein [Dictyobacter alpinus]GCE28605.1 hypothetical protein KDA_40890 [Dictyobacter alpinus]